MSTELKNALKQLIKEYGYQEINSNLFELCMEDKHNTTFGDLDDWYFEILSNGYHNLMWFVYGGLFLFILSSAMISICAYKGVI